VSDRAPESFEKAKNYSFLLLKFRPRSEYEIRERLKRKKFDEPVIKAVLAFLKEKKFIDDEAFTRAWVDFRLKKSLGLRRITQELRLKGIDKDTAAQVLEEAKERYSEPEAIAAVGREKLERLKGIEPQKARRRLYAFLMRRGFSPGAIIDFLEQV
jgi:regulatory protein